jgi:hypothetical protein
MPPPLPLWYPHGATTPERVIRHNRKSAGAVFGGHALSLPKTVFYNLMKTQGFCKAGISGSRQSGRKCQPIDERENSTGPGIPRFKSRRIYI